MVFVKGRRLEAGRGNGSIHVRVVGWVADVDNQFASVKLHVFIAGNVADLELPEGHADEEARGLWHFHSDADVVFRAAGNVQFGGVVQALEVNFDLPGSVRVPCIHLDGDLVVGAADDPDVPGADADAELAPRRVVHLERVVA